MMSDGREKNGEPQMSTRMVTLTAAALLAASIGSLTTVASAMPVDALALRNAAPANIEAVRWGGRGYGWGIGAGLLGGAIIGGALAAPYYYGPGPYYPPAYYAPGPYYPAPGYGPGPGPAAYGAPGGDAVAYCSRKYRSYDPNSGTFLGNDNVRHPCP
jgi:hypothetical protein